MNFFNFFSSLYVVSTRVGGIPEVLPPEFVSLVEPDPKGFHSEIIYFAFDFRNQPCFTFGHSPP